MHEQEQNSTVHEADEKDYDSEKEEEKQPEYESRKSGAADFANALYAHDSDFETSSDDSDLNTNIIELPQIQTGSFRDDSSIASSSILQSPTKPGAQTHVHPTKPGAETHVHFA